MPNLFDKIPIGFFNFLGSGSNNRIYADCLLLIYGEYENEISYRLPRNQIRDVVAAYLADKHPEYADEEAGDERSTTDKASGIIRRLSSSDVGWLEEESDDTTYEKQIIMTDGGIMLAELLERLIQPEREEFSSFIFNIINTLKSREMWKESPYSLCLASVYKESRKLSKSLKKLATFIRRIIEEMMNENTFESLTENLISYFDGDFIKEYSRLAKQQNIHLYKSQIISMLKKLEHSRKDYEDIVNGCKAEHGLDTMQASIRVDEMFSKTQYFLEVEYNIIMNDIKQKINVYLQIAMGRARFLRNKGTDDRGSVERTIRYLVEELDEFGLKDELPDEYMDLFNLEKNEFIDLASIRYPQKKKSIKTASVSEYESLTAEDIARARLEQEEQSFNPYSKELMKDYFENVIGTKQSIYGHDIPMSEKSELLASLSAIAYSAENGFDVVALDGYIQTHELLIRDFEVRRRKR